MKYTDPYVFVQLFSYDKFLKLNYWINNDIYFVNSLIPVAKCLIMMMMAAVVILRT